MFERKVLVLKKSICSCSFSNLANHLLLLALNRPCYLDALPPLTLPRDSCIPSWQISSCCTLCPGIGRRIQGLKKLFLKKGKNKIPAGMTRFASSSDTVPSKSESTYLILFTSSRSKLQNIVIFRKKKTNTKIQNL